MPLDTFLTREFHIRFVDQGCCLQRVPGTFLFHLTLGDASQLRMDQGEEFIERRAVASAPISEQPGYFLRRHGGHLKHSDDQISRTAARILTPLPGETSRRFFWTDVVLNRGTFTTAQ